MDKLWAPWRVKYVTKLAGRVKGCVFCRVCKECKDKTNYVVDRTKYCFSVLNIYPYNNGHILVVPNRHVNDLGKLTREEREDLMDLLESTKKLLNRTIKPGGYNVGMNIGRTAGAGFPGHLHIHVVPRWRGDVNFMPVIGNTKIISQSLKTLLDRLTHANKKRN